MIPSRSRRRVSLVPVHRQSPVVQAKNISNIETKILLVQEGNRNEITYRQKPVSRTVIF